MSSVDIQIEKDKLKAIKTILCYFGKTDDVNVIGDKGWFEVGLGYRYSLGLKDIDLTVLVHIDCFDMGNNKLSRVGYFNIVADCTPNGYKQVCNIKSKFIVVSQDLIFPRKVVFEYTYDREGFGEKSPVMHNLTYNYEEVLEQFCADMITNLQGSYRHFLQMANDCEENTMVYPYLNKNGNSNVEAYKIGRDYIEVKFFDTQKIYRYSYRSASKEKVEKAKSLAIQGFGLNSYIMRCMKYEYEK